MNRRQAREGPLGDKVNRRQAREGPLGEGAFATPSPGLGPAKRLGFGTRTAYTYTMPDNRKQNSLDLDSYVTRKTLDGMFLKLAHEERMIREDPVARSTDLLRKFSGGGR